MKKKILLILFLLSYGIDFSSAQSILNLSFDQKQDSLPYNWTVLKDKDYTVELDSITKCTGKYSLKLQGYSSNLFSYATFFQMTPVQNIVNKTITLHAKLNLDINGSKGCVVLYVQTINKDKKILQLKMDTVSINSIKNTWIDVSTSLKLDRNADFIIFGGMMFGKGTAWVDDLELYINGHKCKEINTKLTPLNLKEKEWLSQNIYPITTTVPDKSTQDFSFFKQFISNKRVVALGESTHTSHETFLVKFRMVKYLVEKMGFTIFSGEAYMEESEAINDYILSGKGNPVDLLNLNLNNWQNIETIEMLKWMKEYNCKNTNKIRFFGFDPQSLKGPSEYLKNILVHKSFDLWKNIDKIESFLQLQRDSIFIASRSKRTDRLTVSLTAIQRKNIMATFQNVRQWINVKLKDKKQKVYALQNVRLLEQYIDLTLLNRDKYMAENLEWIMHVQPNDKIIVWGHNMHIKKSNNLTNRTMGSYIHENIKENYLPICFTFFSNRQDSNGLNKNEKKSYLDISKPGSLEYIFNSLNVPMFLLDCRDIRLSKGNNDWLFEKIYSRGNPQPSLITDDYDAIVYIKESTLLTKNE